MCIPTMLGCVRNEDDLQQLVLGLVGYEERQHARRRRIENEGIVDGDRERRWLLGVALLQRRASIRLYAAILLFTLRDLISSRPALFLQKTLANLLQQRIAREAAMRAPSTIQVIQ